MDEHKLTTPMPVEAQIDLGVIAQSLPMPEATKYPYDLVVVHETTAFLAGQIPKRDGKLAYVGIVGRDVSPVQAHDAARICAQQALAWLNKSAGGLENLDRILRITCFVAHEDDFEDISSVADGASTYLIETLGSKGRHARSVIGVKRLPRNAPVLIEFTAALQHPV